MQKDLETKIKEEVKKVPYKKFIFWEALFVFTTFILGIFVGIKILKITKQQKIVIPAISLWQFIIYFLLASLFILLISFLPRAKKAKKIIYQLLFVFSAIYGGAIALSAFLPDIVSLLLIFSLATWWFKSPNIFSHDLLMILGLAGIAAVLGLSLTPKAVIILLLILSIYDVISVYKTKHMIKMAESMMEAGVITALIIPLRFSELKRSVREVQPGGKFVVLGGGDIVFPLIFAISILPRGTLDTIIISVFAVFGFFASSFLFSAQEQKKPMPALPPIALFSIIGYLIIKFFPQLF